MKEVFRKSLMQICRELNFDPSPATVDKWINKYDATLERVDVAFNVILSPEWDRRVVLQQIKRQLIEYKGAVKTRKNSVSWNPRNGRDFTISFYLKGPQMRSHKGLRRLPLRERLIQECENMIRIEVRLFGDELEKLNLHRPSSWTDETPKRVFELYFRKIRFLNLTSGPITKEDIAKLSSKSLIGPFAAHKLGLDLIETYGTRSGKRYLGLLAKCGMDLRTPDQSERIVVPLNSVLSPDAVAVPPTWLCQAGLLPKPKKRPASSRNRLTFVFTRNPAGILQARLLNRGVLVETG